MKNKIQGKEKIKTKSTINDLDMWLIASCQQVFVKHIVYYPSFQKLQ